MPLILEGKKFEIGKRERVRDLLKRLNLNPEAYLVVRNGSLVTEDEIVSDEDEIKLIRVVSGG